MMLYEKIYNREYKCADLPDQDKRNKKALELIANMKLGGTSFAWATLQSIARYALTGGDEKGDFGIDEEQKALIEGKVV